MAFIPFLISGGIKYKRFKNWLSSWPSKDRKLDIDVGTKALTELLKEKDAEMKLLKKKEISTERFAKEIWLEDSIKSIKSKLINLENNIKEDEFISQFGETPYYYKLRFEIFIIEIAIIFLITGFAYIIFCVVLRKSEKKGEK